MSTVKLLALLKVEALEEGLIMYIMLINIPVT